MCAAGKSRFSLLAILLLNGLSGTHPQDDPARAREQQQRMAATIFGMAIGGLDV